MGVFLISYDLIDEKDYKAIHDRIKTYNRSAHILESAWLISSSQSAIEIRDHIYRSTDNDDKIFVCRLSGNWSTKNVDIEINDWLKSRAFNCTCD